MPGDAKITFVRWFFSFIFSIQRRNMWLSTRLLLTALFILVLVCLHLKCKLKCNLVSVGVAYFKHNIDDAQICLYLLCAELQPLQQHAKYVSKMCSYVIDMSVCAQECHLMLLLIPSRLRSVRLPEHVGVFTTSARPLERLRLAAVVWLVLPSVHAISVCLNLDLLSKLVMKWSGL